VSRYSAGNQLRLLCNGTDYFPALIAAIEAAKTSIFIETYIFADDASARQVASALCAASARGVSVYLTIDSFGSRTYFTAELETLFRAGGVHLSFYRPDVFSMRFRRVRLRRLHRKLALIDGKLAFVGGINVIDDEHSPVLKPPRVDFAVAVQGPVVAQIATAMQWLWRVQRLAHPSQHLPMAEPVNCVTQAVGLQTAKLVLRDNFRFRRDIESAYLTAIRGARQEVLIATAYFFPGVGFRRALIQAAKRGVRVTLLLQDRIEYRLLTHATKALYGQLLQAGIVIHEHEASFLHAKVAVVDGQWATVGSSNIDPLSLLLAREANLCVRDALFANELGGKVRQLIETGAREVTLADWRQRSLGQRLLHWLAFGWARLLIGVFAYDGRGWLEGRFTVKK
jgi:cardiolipin synthase A/B